MTPNSIKALLELRNKSQKEIAEAIGVSKNELSMVIGGIRSTPESRKKFAEHLGMKVEEIFDDEFEAVIAHRKSKQEAATC
jgi:transcriptional regulator with XRE-family HTH domain